LGDALLLAPLIVGAFGISSRSSSCAGCTTLTILRPAADLRPDADRRRPVPQGFFGSSGLPYPVPDALAAFAPNLGFMILPNYRAWVVVASLVVCLATWYVIEKTKLGAYLRAGIENRPDLVRSLRHQRAAHGHADLRLRRGAGRLCRRARCADLQGHLR
jgi:branched-chain amino acid transport system permease protein